MKKNTICFIYALIASSYMIGWIFLFAWDPLTSLFQFGLMLLFYATACEMEGE